MKLEDSQLFLTLVRLGIGHTAKTQSQGYNWNSIKAIAEQHELNAVVLDGIECLPSSNRPPQTELLEWIGEVIQTYENRYDVYVKSISELAGFYNSHGLKMMVLKGYACSLDWPKAEHRPCGDIDIWQFGEYKKGDELIKKEKGINVDKSHHHHTVFCWYDFAVENHYDFLNVHNHKSNRGLEKILKELGKDDSHFVEIKDASTGSATKVYLPSPNLHALFLLRHTMLHFSVSGITIRNLLDWAFFVQAHGKEVNWTWLIKVLESYGMKQLFHIFNAICVEDLGFSSVLFPEIQYLPLLKEKVLNEILCPKVPNNKPKQLIKRVFWKINRWKAGRWKYELTYNNSLWSEFWRGLWSHLLKPSSI